MLSRPGTRLGPAGAPERGRRGLPGGAGGYSVAMATMPSAATGEDTAQWRTHTVANQPPPLTGLDVFSSNLPLVEATEREGAGWVTERASALGRFVGGAPQLERQRQDVLPHRHRGQHAVHGVRGGVAHPTGAAARADATAFTGESAP